MGTRYYHADRVGKLSPGAVLNFQLTPEDLKGNTADRADIIRQYWPKGLSKHGSVYLSMKRGMPMNTDHLGAIEAIFEAVRRAKAPHMVSRYEALFASKTLEDAGKFMNNFRVQASNTVVINTSMANSIWEVETDSRVFVGDMAWLSLGEQWTDPFIFAESYWDGKLRASARNSAVEVLMEYPIKVIRRVA